MIDDAACAATGPIALLRILTRLQDIRLVRGLCIRESILYSQTPPLFGHPPTPLYHPHYCLRNTVTVFSPPTILYCNT